VCCWYALWTHREVVLTMANIDDLIKAIEKELSRYDSFTFGIERNIHGRWAAEADYYNIKQIRTGEWCHKETEWVGSYEKALSNLLKAISR